MTVLLKKRIIDTKPALREKLGVKNDLALPRLVKVVVNTGVGKRREKKTVELTADRLAKITGQKAAPRGSKKSIASFKVRQGETIGLVVTLRGKQMQGFLDKLINVAIPRMRDFRGLNPKAVDEHGNLTIGIREHTIFPETADEDLRDVFGFAITVVSTAGNRVRGLELFRSLGFPFSAEEPKKRG